MKNILKPIDRQLAKYSPDQFVLRLNEIVKAINKLNNKSVDLNGWTVFDYGDWKEYEIAVPYNVTVTNGQRSEAGEVKQPYGVDSSKLSFSVGSVGNYSGHAVYGIELGNGLVYLNIGNEYSGGALVFVGTAYIRARTL